MSSKCPISSTTIIMLSESWNDLITSVMIEKATGGVRIGECLAEMAISMKALETDVNTVHRPLAPAIRSLGTSWNGIVNAIRDGASRNRKLAKKISKVGEAMQRMDLELIAHGRVSRTD